LKYTDPDGEFVITGTMLAIAAGVGGIANVALNWDDIVAQGGGWNSIGQAGKYFTVGAVVGVGGLYLGAALAPVYGTGAIAGAIVGIPTGFATGFGNSAIGTGRVDLDTFKAGATGAAFGFMTGGLVAGAIAGVQGNNFWTGVTPGGNSPSFNLKDANWTPWKHPNAPPNTSVPEGHIEFENPKMTKFADNDIVNYNRENLLNRLERHSFSDHHLKDGLMDIGSRDFIKNSAVDIIDAYKAMLRPGRNNIVANINGYDVTVTAFVKDKTVIGINIWRNVRPQYYKGIVINTLGRFTLIK
jgi:hypothetical protein